MIFDIELILKKRTNVTLIVLCLLNQLKKCISTYMYVFDNAFLAIIFGAFGAHALKKKLNNEQLQSFETGVKYQMYHAIVLLILGFNFTSITSISYWFFTIGIIFFSFSIYGLVLSSAKGKKMKFLLYIKYNQS